MKEKEKVKFTNGMFNFFMDMSNSNSKNKQYSSSIMKVLDSEFKEEYSSERHKLFRLFHAVTGSPEFKAFLDTRNELFKKFEEKQNLLSIDKRKPPLLMNIDGMVQLLEADSGFEIEKISILSKSMPSNIKPIDMVDLSWIINFIDDNGGDGLDAKGET